MDKSYKLWITLMYFFDKYWGCHQIAERSFYFRGYQLPVCARCTGMIIGEITAIIIYTLGFRILFAFCILMMLPMAIDGGLQLITTYSSTNFRRVITGFTFGFAFLQLILPGFTYVIRLI